MVEDVPRLGLAVFSVLKALNRVEKIHICCGREQCQHEGFNVQMNSDVIFGCDFYDVK